MAWRTLARVIVLLGSIGIGLVGAAGTAAAHGSGGLGPEAHMPQVRGLDPPVPGLTVTVIESGARLRIDNRTGAAVDVLPPTGAPRTAEPVVAAGSTARWADPRVSAAAGRSGPGRGPPGLDRAAAGRGPAGDGAAVSRSGHRRRPWRPGGWPPWSSRR